MVRFRFYPLNIGRGHEGPENTEMVVHLASPVAFDGNVRHSLVLHFFLVLGRSRSLSLSPFGVSATVFSFFGSFFLYHYSWTRKKTKVLVGFGFHRGMDIYNVVCDAAFMFFSLDLGLHSGYVGLFFPWLLLFLQVL